VTVPARLAAFAAVLMLVFIAAFVLGMAVGPVRGGPAVEREPSPTGGHAAGATPTGQAGGERGGDGGGHRWRMSGGGV
jgi:hypothetical protein